MTDKEVMRLALIAMENIHKTGDTQVFDMYDAPEIIPALRAALAQPEQAECDGGQCGIGGYCKQCPKTQPELEPVAWLDSDGFPWSDEGIACRSIKDTYKPLYTAPPQRTWVGLTDEEVKDILDCGRPNLVNIKKAEQKLKEKNND